MDENAQAKALEASAREEIKEIVRRAKVKPNRSLRSDYRTEVLACRKIDGHEHEYKDVIYFPQEIYREEIMGKLLYFVPVVPVNQSAGKTASQRAVLPICFLDFTNEQKKEIKFYGKKKGWSIVDYYFTLQKSTACKSACSSDFEEADSEQETVVYGMRKLIPISQYFQRHFSVEEAGVMGFVPET